LTYRFASQGAEGEKKLIPVYLRCKRLNLNQTPLPEFIMQQINEDCDNRNIYLTLTAADNFLETPMILLFDGLDEIEDESTSRRIAAELVKLRKGCPRCRIIISSRPIGLKKENYPGFYHAELLPLDAEMIQNYLGRWFKNDADRVEKLLATFQHKPRIAALATNPFLLSMICFTYQHGGDTALIERRSDLYANCTRFLLERRYADDTRAKFSDKEFQDILEILKELSLRFFLWQEADFPVDHVNVMGNRILKADDLGRTEQFLDAIQRQTGLIQRAKEGFTFVHRSLWEYFTALALLDKKTEFVIRHAADPFWEEVVRLYAGLLKDDHKVKNLVNGLWNINRPLALRVTTEVKIPAADLIKPLIERETGNQNKLLLIDSVEQSLPLISETERQNLIHETLQILLVECEEHDCEVIYYAQRLLERQGMKPLEPGGIIYRLFELKHAEERQRQLLDDPENCFQWIEVKGGTFWMGDDNHHRNERPAHRVKIDRFFMSKHPVTNRMLSLFPFGEKYHSSGGEKHPASGNTWWEAYYFALWIGVQLPTEAQWEYAARGGKYGKRTLYYFGDNEAELIKHAWFGETGKQCAHAVNEPNPLTCNENLNPLGLANMLGNVWEWCAEWYADYPEPQADEGLIENPTGPTHGTYKIQRGGSFIGISEALRCSRRYLNHPENRRYTVGFRVVRRPSPSFENLEI
jgi:formylglycine-generating enzyme required for sulfatase activity